MYHIATCYKAARVDLEQAAAYAQRSLDLLLQYSENGTIETSGCGPVRLVDESGLRLSLVHLIGTANHLLSNQEHCRQVDVGR